MNSDRIKEIQEQTAYPNSKSVQQALLKVWNECELKDELQTYKHCVKMLDGWRKQIKQQNKAIKRKNKLIRRLRYDNPHFRKWCWLYGTDPKTNPWIKNIGSLPGKIPMGARIDALLLDGGIFTGLYAFNEDWALNGRLGNIIEWRFHNSKEK